MSSRNKRRGKSKQGSRQSNLANRQDQHAQAEQQQEEARLVAMQAEFRGPLPPPEVLERYEEVYPGTAERILQQFERETQHRHAIEQKLVDGQLEVQRAEIPAFRLGPVFAFIIAVVGLLAAAYCVNTAPSAGHAWAGAGIAGISLATLAGVFIYGRKTKAAEEEAEE
jgi:uncharacterized membrane protein